MLILSDFHHASLLNSFIMLFEGRLGGQVYRPIGREWYDQGFWHVYEHPATVAQFLDIGGANPDGTQPVNEVEGQPEPDVYLCHDIDSDMTNRAITFKGFMAKPFDILIASIPQHVECYKKLAALHPNHPKVIFQIGNAWTIEAGMAPNIMASAIIQGVPADINFISYHQEFDLNKYHPPLIPDHFDGAPKMVFGPQYDFCHMPPQNIYSFVNCFNIAEHLNADWQLFEQVEQAMPTWQFKSYGGQCRDGSANGSQAVADKIREARFVWHTKYAGDGYGHIVHNVPACGRPLLVKQQYYFGKLAQPLLVDGVTCIAIDGLDCPQIINKIEYYSDPVRYSAMARAAYDNFMRVVNFDAEAEQIKLFLAKLI